MTPENMNINIHALEQALKREKGIRYTLMFVIAVLLFAFLSKSSTTKIINQPLGTSNQDSYIVDGQASQKYLKDITQELSQYAFTFTPKTVEENFNALKKTVDPEHYGALNKFLVKKVVDVKQSNLSSVFFPSEYQYDLKNHKVAAKGVLKTFSGDKPVLNEKVAILFEYSLNSHTLRMIGFTDVTNQRNPFAVVTKDK